MRADVIENLKTWPVYLVNLAHRCDRLEKTLETLRDCGWTSLFRWPTIYRAVHGWKLPVPAAYGGGMAGAFGCKRSHEDCLAESIELEQPGVIVLEDDFEVLEGRDFVGEMRRFLEAVPDEWDQLMPGYQGWHLPVEKVSSDVVRIKGSNRTHFYMIRDRAGVEMRKELYRHWTSNVGHCDHLMSAIQPAYNVFGPVVQVCGQRKTFSDITGRDEDFRDWIIPVAGRPIIVLHAPDAVITELVTRRIFNVIRPAELDPIRLRPVLATTQTNSAVSKVVTALIHADANTSVVKSATDDPVFSVCGNSVDEVIERLPLEVRQALNMAEDGSPFPERVCILPYYGEFGWMILRHVRWVHQLHARVKIVCCRRGEECLYPSATGFFYEWPEGVPDALRCEDGYGDDTTVRSQLEYLYPGHAVIRPDCGGSWAWDHAKVKFRPAVRHELRTVDVALCVRRRDHGTEKNWSHWTAVAEAIRGAGYSVGLVGAEATSYADTPADVRAWDHTAGATDGTVDLLTRCRLYVGGDTGVSHLAAMMDVPSIVFAPPHHYHGWAFTNYMERATDAHFRQLPASAWTDPEEVIAAVLAYLATVVRQAA